MAKHAKKPENVIGMHYFSPVPKMPLLEIVKTDQTADSVIASCYDFGIKQGKTCIVVKDAPGFYVNRILGPYMNECLVMIDEGLDFTVIDKALKKKGFPVGPITLFDQVGLDIAAHVVGSSEKMIGTRDGFKLSYGVVKMFEAGRLGRKNKSGFYNYDKNSKKQGPDKSAYQFFEGNGDKSLPLEDIQNRALMLMLNEAVLCLEEGIIANPTDGDIGAVFGIGFLPFTGGPFSYMDYLGASKVVEIMNDLVAKYGKKYTPAKTLIDFANNGGKFHA
jgi:3-hydroxyacyl-CoA dehydrogenase/enoyl-CoA hydratase/3-hydroxybutyryl-CoA epimerase